MRLLVATDDGKQPRLVPVHLEADTGRLEQLGEGIAVPGAGWFELDSARKQLFTSATVETGTGGREGQLSAWYFDAGQVTAEHRFTLSTEGFSPCHFKYVEPRNLVLLVNYTGPDDCGSVRVIAINHADDAAKLTDRHQHEGAGPHPTRQRHSHPHYINIDNNSQFAWVPDLGIDQIVSYRLDDQHPVLRPNANGGAKVPAGSGPRHLAFHPNGRWVYAIMELSNEVASFELDGTSGELTPLQTCPTLPAEFRGENTAAELLVHPSGRWLLGSNRGHDSIAVYRIDDRGELSFLQCQTTGGGMPRHCMLTPQGDFLLVSNTTSDHVVAFRWQDGALEATDRLALAQPRCLQHYAD